MKKLIIIALITIQAAFSQSYYAAKDAEYTIDPDGIGIVQGEVSSSVALQNRIALNAAMQAGKHAKHKIINIPEMDAYFDVTTITGGRSSFTPRYEALQIPAGVTLKMTDETHIRVQPNNENEYELMTNNLRDNISICGGNLYGDRDTHDYSGGGNGEHGHTLVIRAGKNVLVDGTNMSQGLGDGLDIKGLNFVYNSNYDFTDGVVVRNCHFDYNRRNNISITDGYNIVIENNLLTNAGQPTPNSTGTAPMVALDIEPHFEQPSGQTPFYTEAVGNITVRNNIEQNSLYAGIIITQGDDIDIYNNDFETQIGYSHGQNISIHNNDIHKNQGGVSFVYGIFTGSDENSVNNEIYNNTITGFEGGARMDGNNINFHDNTLTDNKISLFAQGVLKNNNISNNTIESDVASSDGIFFQLSKIDSTLVSNNTITVNRFPLRVLNVNTSDPEFRLDFQDNIFNSTYTANFQYANGIDISNNEFNTGIEIVGSNDIYLYRNNISAGNKDGIRFRDAASTDIHLQMNEINSLAQPIRIDTDPVNFTSIENVLNGVQQ